MALGGGLLIDGGNVALSNVALMNDAASGAVGAGGAVGRSATAGHPRAGPAATAAPAATARGGGIYLASGNLTLTGDLIEDNVARGGAGGAGGRGGYGYSVQQTSSGCSSIGPLPFRQCGAGRQRRAGW